MEQVEQRNDGPGRPGRSPARPGRRLAAGLALATLVGTLPWALPAAGAPRSVTATPGTGLEDGDVVTVRWSGFGPGGLVTVAQCQVGAVAAERRGACAWGADRVASSDSSGSGEVAFRVWAGTLANPSGGTLASAVRYPDERGPGFVVPLRCDAAQACEVAVTEDSLVLRAGRSAASAALSFSTVPGPDWPRARPAVPPEDPGAAWPPRSPDAPTPAPGTVPLMLRGTGANANADLITRWLRNVDTGRQPIAADYLELGSTDGNRELVTGFENGFASARPGVDFAVTGIPLTPEEVQSIGGPEKVAYAPVSLGSLAIAYRFRHSATWQASAEVDEETGDHAYSVEGANVAALRLTAAFIARAYADAGGGSEGDWKSPHFTSLNGPVQVPVGSTSTSVGVLFRRDGSAQTQLLLDWLYDRIGGKEYARLFPTAVVPGPVIPVTRLGQAAVGISRAGEAPAALENVSGQGSQERWANTQRIGYLETSTFHKAVAGRSPFLRKHGELGLTHIENAAGRLVQPSDEGVLAAVGAADVRPDGTVKLDFADPDPRIYPLAQVHYLAVPTEGLPAEKQVGLARMLEYMVSDAGQRVAAEEGFVPLPPKLRDQSLAVAARLRSTGPTATTTTTTTVPGSTTPAVTAASDVGTAPDQGTATAAGTAATATDMTTTTVVRSGPDPSFGGVGRSFASGGTSARRGSSSDAPTTPVETAAAESPERGGGEDDDPAGRGGVVPKAATALGITALVVLGVAGTMGGGVLRWRLTGGRVPGFARSLPGWVNARRPGRRRPR